jgi:hypothetical protein
MRTISLIAVCATVAVLTGCAVTSRGDDVDSAKVAAINHVASARGIEVHWVNYPQRRSALAAPTAPVTGS